MSEKNLNILMIVAAVLFLVTVVLYSGINFFADSFRPGTPLIQGLDTGGIAAIEITGGDGNTVTLNRRDDRFAVQELFNYPADTAKVNELLIALMEIGLDEKVSTNPASFAELGVADDSAEAVTVRLLDQDGKLLTGVVKGKAVGRGTGVYVRLADGETAYATQAALRVQTKPIDFIDKQILEVEAGNINEVTVQVPGGETYTIVRRPPEGEDEEGEIVLQSVPEGREADEDEYEEVFEAAEDISITDVIPASEKTLNWDGAYHCRLSNGLVYHILTAKDGEDYYITVTAESPLREDLTLRRDESDEELKKKEELLLANDTAEDFNTLHSGWIYKLSSYEAEILRRPVDELLVPLDDESEEN